MKPRTLRYTIDRETLEGVASIVARDENSIGLVRRARRDKLTKGVPFYALVALAPLGFFGFLHVVTGRDVMGYYGVFAIIFGITAAFILVLLSCRLSTYRALLRAEMARLIRHQAGPGVLGETVMEVSDDGVDVANEYSSTNYPWYAVLWVGLHDACVTLHVTGLRFVVIPKSAFRSDADAANFAGVCRELAERTGGMEFVFRESIRERFFLCTSCGNDCPSGDQVCPRCGKHATPEALARTLQL
ncbi:MAG: YcxB family protein [Planctomycetota bacterium]